MELAIDQQKKVQTLLVELVGGTDVDWPKDDYRAARRVVNQRINDYIVDFYEKTKDLPFQDFHEFAERAGFVWEKLRLGLREEVSRVYADQEQIKNRLLSYIGSEEHGRIAHLEVDYMMTRRPSWIDEYRT